MFSDRHEAVERLARALAKYRGQRPLVAAIPRGAGARPRHRGRAWGGLGVVFVRKLRAGLRRVRWAPLTARRVYIASRRGAGADDTWLGRCASAEGDPRTARGLHPHRPPLITQRTVIVVDDGLATGMTMIAALRAVRARGAPWVVCAVAVASPAGLERVRPFADDVVCLATPEDFAGVSLFYDDFAPVTDADAIRLVRPARSAIA
jgi:predicted phosphoribosyltransferase